MVYTTEQTSDGTNIKNFCPDCLNLGLRSKFIKKSAKIEGSKYPHEKFYDENGREHYHDSNIRIGNYHCSQGHTGTYYKTLHCSICNYPNSLIK